MIIQRHPSGTLAIRQVDHAKFAGFLLEHWTDHNFTRNPNREKILLATCEHDNGWEKWDAAPRLDGRRHIPVDFTHITAEESREIWKRSTERWLEEDPFVALLITHHAYAINEHAHKHSGEWKEFFIHFAGQRAGLRDRLGFMQNDVEASYSFLRMADWFSLMFCSDYKLGVAKTERYAGYTIRREGENYLFRPYPFHERGLRYQLPVYPMKKGGYASDKELRAALKTPEYHEIALHPLERWD